MKQNLSYKGLSLLMAAVAFFIAVAPAYAQRRSDFARQIGLGKGVRRKRAGK